MTILKLRAKRDQYQEEGFTLIELLVVILIIGILAAIAVPMYINNRKTGVDSTVKSDVKNAATQVEAWIANYPTSITPINNSTATGTTLEGIKPSQGTKLSIYGNTHDYCVEATNDSGAESKDGYKYQSEEGSVSKGTCENYSSNYSIP